MVTKSLCPIVLLRSIFWQNNIQNSVMKFLAPILFFLLLLVACEQPKMQAPLNPVPFTAVKITDQFWAPKIETNRTVSIPSAFKKSEETGRMANFALAGGLIEGEHQGDFPFDDTDLYKILEGASYTLAVSYDAELDHYLDSLIVLVSAAQEDDGYLYTCITNKCERLKRWYGEGRWDRLNSHELYNCGHLYEAAVAHFRATGKRTLLNVAIKNADLIDRVFGAEEGKKKVPSGHPIIEMALVKLYRVTNDEKYLKLARFFIDETGKGTDGHELNRYSQDHQPIVEQGEAVGHAVRFGYLYSGVTDVASLQHDRQLMEATKRVWENVVSKKMYITGGIGSRAQGEGFGENYELPNMTGYCETCAAISNVYWNYRLFLNEKNSKYYDVLERVLYNGVLSGVSLSGDKFFYDNPLESVHNHDRAPWFGCACCPGNITRFMASIPGYMYATAEQTLYVNLFAAGSANIVFGADTLQIHQQTRYPWDGAVEITIDRPISTSCALKIRIPGWSNNQAVPSNLYRFIDESISQFKIAINGEQVTPKVENGYAVIDKKWLAGDKLTFNFDMPVRQISANDMVENDRGKLVCQRGPIVYCFEDKDNGDASLFDCFIRPEAKASARFDSTLLGGIVTLLVDGNRVVKQGDSSVVISKTLTAIPYYAWNNRGTANMVVWMADNKASVTSPHKPLASDSAVMSASTGWGFGLNDGFEPSGSDDFDKSYFYWWLKKGTKEWVQYDFNHLVTIEKSDVYWLNMTHYDGDFRVPTEWSLSYRDADGAWQPVETTDSYLTQLDCFNTVRFAPITTSGIRLNVTLAEAVSGGILEWEIN